MSQEIKKTVVPVLIVGESGTGKSTGIQTLPPERTVILNTEEKTLPFAHENNFKVINISSYKKLDAVLTQLDSEKGQVFDYIVLDSLTSATEIVDRYSTAMFSGFEQWKQYSLLIQDVVLRLKRMKQQIFVTAIPETRDESFSEKKKYTKIKGKELKYGFVEAQFSIVLYTLPQYSEDDGEMEGIDMQFKPNKNNTAKAPVGLFDKKPSNDYLAIANRIEKFYQGRADAEVKEEK